MRNDTSCRGRPAGCGCPALTRRCATTARRADLVFHVSSGYTQASVSWNALPGAGAYRLQITPADQDALFLSSDEALNFPVIPFNPRLSYTATVTTLTGDGATASASVRYTPPPALPALFLPDTLAPLLEPWQDALPAAPTIVAADNALVEDAPLLADSLAWTPEDRFRRSSPLDPFDRSRSYSLHGGTGADSFARGHRPASLVPGNPANARAGLDRLWSCIGGEAPPAQPQPAGGAGGAAPSSPGLSFPGELQQPATDLGGLGRIYRGSHSSGPALVVYRFVSATEGEVAFWVTQGEVAAAGAAV